MNRHEALQRNSNHANFVKSLHGLDRVLQDFALREELYQTSFEQAKSFTFGGTVRGTEDIFLKTSPKEVQFL